jgi:hypothetical protein
MPDQLPTLTQATTSMGGYRNRTTAVTHRPGDWGYFGPLIGVVVLGHTGVRRESEWEAGQRGWAALAAASGRTAGTLFGCT